MNRSAQNGSRSNRRTVLKTIGAGIVGGTVTTGSAAAHGDDPLRLPSWFENEIWEMTATRSGPTPHEAHAPVWHLEPGAAHNGCAQVEGFDFSLLAAHLDALDSGAWDSVDYDHTLSANPFSSLWGIKFVFDDDASRPYVPGDMVNEADSGDGVEALISGEKIRAAADEGSVTIVDAHHAFNCPIRPADEVHSNYCD